MCIRDSYDHIVELVSAHAPAREEYLNSVRAEVSEVLKAAGIKATVTGRPKHYWSVYQKMVCLLYTSRCV